MKVLVATDKPFAKVAVDGIRKEIEGAYEVDREFRTSQRALNVLSARVRTVRAGDFTCRRAAGANTLQRFSKKLLTRA